MRLIEGSRKAHLACSPAGHIIGVIHEMFVVDGSDWTVRDGGAHGVFQHSNPNERDGPIRDLLVAGGDDLQERKKLLVKAADAVVVLPGGPGTWDEVRFLIKYDYLSTDCSNFFFRSSVY
jgi:hypothetical protein